MLKVLMAARTIMEKQSNGMDPTHYTSSNCIKHKIIMYFNIDIKICF